MLGGSMKEASTFIHSRPSCLRNSWSRPMICLFRLNEIFACIFFFFWDFPLISGTIGLSEMPPYYVLPSSSLKKQTRESTRMKTPQAEWSYTRKTVYFYYTFVWYFKRYFKFVVHAKIFIKNLFDRYSVGIVNVFKPLDDFHKGNNTFRWASSSSSNRLQIKIVFSSLSHTLKFLVDVSFARVPGSTTALMVTFTW